MRVAICDDNQQDIERDQTLYTAYDRLWWSMCFYTRPEELLRECADAG